MAPSSRSIRRPRTGLRTSAIRVNCLVEDLSIAVRRLGVIGAGPSTREGGLSVRRVVTEEVGGRSRILAGEVVLHPGDCVVQRATNHAWHNYNDTPVRLLAVLLGLP